MKIALIEFVTLDGVSQGPGSPTEDASDGFTRGGWLVPHLDELFVRRTSDWPDLADETPLWLVDIVVGAAAAQVLGRALGEVLRSVSVDSTKGAIETRWPGARHAEGSPASLRGSYSTAHHPS